MNDKWFLGARRVFFALFACWVTLPAFATHRALVEETADAVKVGNGSVELIVPKGKAFNIQSMKLNDGEEMVVPSTNAIPWVLTYKGIQGENPMLFPEHGVYKGYEVIQNDTSASVVFVWDMRLSYEKRMYPIRMKVTATDHSELLYWDLTADLPKGWVISKAQFPRIAVVRPKDGKMITSAGWGNEFDMATGGAYKVTYPSCTGSMQLLLMHNGEGSFYYATEDRNACGKELRAVCGSKSVTFVTEVVTSEGWTDATTGRFDLPWTTVVGYNPDGWQAAALQWYRPFTFTCEWGNKSLQSRNIPQWLLDKDLWIRSKGVADTVMAAINKTIDFFGEGIGVHTYYWHNYPYDTHYPDYFPAKPEFEGMISTIQKRKCHAVPYINGRLWDPAADSYTALNGASASCRKADGTLYTEIYPTSKVLNTVTCPASSLWHEIIIGLADKIQNELHTNGVYIDQIAAAAPQPCFAKIHGHAAGGGDFWYKSYKALIDSIRGNHLRKDNIVFSEENSECYIPLFDMLLTVNTPHANCRIVPLFPTVYSDRVITCAYTYTPTADVTKGEFRYQNMQCFLYGSQLGWVDPTLLMRDEAKTEATFLRTLMELRKKQHDIFIEGRYIREFVPGGDNPQIDVPTFGKNHVVMGSEWQSKGGQHVWYVVNMDTQAHEVILPSGKSLKMKPLSGKRINL